MENLEDNLEEKKDNLEMHFDDEKYVGVSTTKVEHLNFNGDRFKSEPQQPDQVADIKTAEKFVSDTNRMMEEVKDDETKLEKSVKRQEILTEQITRIGNSATVNTMKLSRRQETNNTRETQKMEQLNLELSTKLNDLELKRDLLETQVPSNMTEKVNFIRSREGQKAIQELLVDSLVENNKELISLAESMSEERDVVNEDPKSQFVELIERLNAKHNFLELADSKEEPMEGAVPIDGFEDNTLQDMIPSKLEPGEAWASQTNIDSATLQEAIDGTNSTISRSKISE